MRCVSFVSMPALFDRGDRVCWRVSDETCVFHVHAGGEGDGPTDYLRPNRVPRHTTTSRRAEPHSTTTTTTQTTPHYTSLAQHAPQQLVRQLRQVVERPLLRRRPLVHRLEHRRLAGPGPRPAALGAEALEGLLGVSRVAGGGDEEEGGSSERVSRE